MKTLLVKCPSVQWQPDGLTIHTKRWFLAARFLGAPPHLSHFGTRGALRSRRRRSQNGRPDEARRARTNTMLLYNMLLYTILYYTILHYTTLHYTILYYTILYCISCLDASPLLTTRVQPGAGQLRPTQPLKQANYKGTIHKLNMSNTNTKSQANMRYAKSFSRGIRMFARCRASSL